MALGHRAANAPLYPGEPEIAHLRGRILSPSAAALHCLTDTVATLPFDADRIAEQEFDVWFLQPLLFVIESVEQLAEEIVGWARRRGLR